MESNFRDMGECYASPPQWILKHTLPIGLTVVAGPPKSFKSTIVLDWAAQIAGVSSPRYSRLTSEVLLPGPAAFLSFEATGGELRHTLEKGFGANLDTDGSLFVADTPEIYRLDSPKMRRKLLRELAELAPRLLVIDPFADAHDGEENDAAEVIAMVRPLREWALNTESGVIFVHHTRKRNQERTGDLDTNDIRGSSALFGKADGIHIVTPLGNRKIRLQSVFKRGPEITRELKMDVFAT